jgi:hypothetical protein
MHTILKHTISILASKIIFLYSMFIYEDSIEEVHPKWNRDILEIIPYATEPK